MRRRRSPTRRRGATAFPTLAAGTGRRTRRLCRQDCRQSVAWRLRHRRSVHHIGTCWRHAGHVHAASASPKATPATPAAAPLRRVDERALREAHSAAAASGVSASIRRPRGRRIGVRRCRGRRGRPWCRRQRLRVRTRRNRDELRGGLGCAWRSGARRLHRAVEADACDTHLEVLRRDVPHVAKLPPSTVAHRPHQRLRPYNTM